MKKTTSSQLITTTLAIGLIAGSSLTASAVAVSRTTAGRSQVDTGNSIIQVDVNPNTTGSFKIQYGGGDMTGGWWNDVWNITAGAQTYLKVGKHFVVDSPGYPKLSSNVADTKRAQYTAAIAPNTTMHGQWQIGCYIWLDDNASGTGTHEINVWNRSYSLTRSYTYHGTHSNDGSDYKVYSFQNNGFKSWVCLRQSTKFSMNAAILKWLDAIKAYGMPNHSVINILAACEGHYAGGSGKIAHTDYGIPNL